MVELHKEAWPQFNLYFHQLESQSFVDTHERESRRPTVQQADRVVYYSSVQLYRYHCRADAKSAHCSLGLAPSTLLAFMQLHKHHQGVQA